MQPLSLSLGGGVGGVPRLPPLPPHAPHISQHDIEYRVREYMKMIQTQRELMRNGKFPNDFRKERFLVRIPICLLRYHLLMKWVWWFFFGIQDQNLRRASQTVQPPWCHHVTRPLWVPSTCHASRCGRFTTITTTTARRRQTSSHNGNFHIKYYHKKGENRSCCFLPQDHK